MIHSLPHRSLVCFLLCLSAVWFLACGPQATDPATLPADQRAAASNDASESEENESASTPDSAPAPDHQPDPKNQEFENNIKWSTASEVENAGFNVYRGDSEDGPFERLNDELIEGAYTTDEPSSYSFLDREIDPYRSYFYYVESVSLSGVRENFTPVIRAKPKLPPTE